MSHLAVVFPPAERLRLPFSRSQVMLLYIATNFLFLGLDTYLVHYANLTIRPDEWIPIIFSPIAAGLLLLAGLLAFRQRSLASLIATLTMLGSIVVGLLGAYFHFLRGIQPFAPPGQRVSLDLLVWAPPVLGPLMFAVVGVLGISAAWPEDPPGSGILALPFGRHLQLPYPKTQAYFYIVSMAALATLISSVLDHARFGLESFWIWPPIAIGIFGTVVAAALGAIDEPSRGDLITYSVAMFLFILIGVIGAWLHFGANLIAGGTIVEERFLRGAPLLAPMLFANVGVFGFITLLSSKE
jgi:MprA protease rhombosortase-interaction domain-containing protein